MRSFQVSSRYTWPRGESQDMHALMGYGNWRGGFRQRVRGRSRLRRIGDILLFCTLAVGMLYGIARFLPEHTTQGGAQVIDGDSLTVDGEEIRLTGMDAPEARQTCLDEQGRVWPCGRQATLTLKELTRKVQVVCKGSAHDKYGRLLARCIGGRVDAQRRDGAPRLRGQ